MVLRLEKNWASSLLSFLDFFCHFSSLSPSSLHIRFLHIFLHLGQVQSSSWSPLSIHFLSRPPVALPFGFQPFLDMPFLDIIIGAPGRFFGSIGIAMSPPGPPMSSPPMSP